MGTIFHLPSREGFGEQERNRIAAVAASVGATVAWYRTECGGIWGCLASADNPLGTITRKKGMVLWFPKDSLSPFVSHINLDECLAKIGKICGLQTAPSPEDG